MMAPESERAHEKDCPCWGDIAPHLDCTCEPTLACSEVVERLANDLADALDALIAKHGIEQLPYEFYEAYRAKMRMILHSWRERRVQELEAGLLRYGRHLVTCPHLSENMRSNSDCNCDWDEWREQIRKGAKHE